MRSWITTTIMYAAWSALPALAQTPLGTEFTYQGHLEQAGVPVNDTADFLFSLFTDAVGGTQIGVTLGVSNVTVTDGLFSVQLGFGSAAFSGDQRFLEIAVRSPAGSGSYTTLTPRQPLTAAPYALYALSSGAPWATSGNNIHNTNTGNVAVGHDTAAYKLDVLTDGTAAIKGVSSDTQVGGVGVYGQNDGPGGNGVVGLNTAAGGTGCGVWAQSDSSTGRGLIAYGQTAVFGYGYPYSAQEIGGQFVAYSTTGLGVYGFVGAGSGATKAILGECLSPSGHAVYAAGNFAATGTKSFRIDHPLDPENKYLVHYCSEGPEPLNVYRGTVTLNAAGEALVELPYYFATINKDPSYTLTAVGAPMPRLHVAEEIDEAALSAGAQLTPGQAAPSCSFRIAGGVPGAKVSWRVEAVRNDLWVQQYGAPVEVDKPEAERGTYQHPDLYGQPRERGTYYRAAPESLERPAAPDEVPAR
jgi:hypothetical protein